MTFRSKQWVYSSLFIFVGLLSSCTKILDTEFITPDPKLVVNGLISPDSSLKINLSKSLPIFADEGTDNLPFVEGATVRFLRNGQFLFQLEEGDYGNYQKSDFFPAANQNYSIEIEKAGFPNLKAETTIPEAVLIQNIDTTMSRDARDEYYESIVFNVSLSYTDPAGIDNFYRLDCLMSFVDEQGNTYTGRQWLYVDDGLTNFYDKTNDYLLWNDQLTDGQNVSIHFNIYFDIYYDPNGGGGTLPINYLLILSSVNEDFYKYDKSRSIFNESGGSDNPFSEPVVIFSNAENGLGIFGGLSSDTTSFNYFHNPFILK